MVIKAWFKSKTADRVLKPVRDSIIDLIEPKSNVLEIGCGTGQLLFDLREKINFGVGLDIDQQMINFSVNKVEKLNVKNLAFFKARIETIKDCSDPIPPDSKVDICTATLCIHEMKQDVALAALNEMTNLSKKVIIADFSRARSLRAKMAIEIDEAISGHYSQYRAYKQNGYYPYLASLSNLNIVYSEETSIDGVTVWVMDSKT